MSDGGSTMMIIKQQRPEKNIYAILTTKPIDLPILLMSAAGMRRPAAKQTLGRVLSNEALIPCYFT